MQDHAVQAALATSDQAPVEAAVGNDQVARTKYTNAGAVPNVGGDFKDPPPSASDRAFGDAQGDHQHHDKSSDAAKDKPQDKPDDGQIHIVTEAGLRHLRQSGPDGVRAAKELYDNPDAYIVLKAGQQMPEGWKGNATMLFPSFALFKHAVHHGKLPKNLKAVVYDNEHWEQTPLHEKENAALYAKRFEHLAHEHGLTFIAAPTTKFFKQDARYADIVDVQLQDRESNTTEYTNALEHDAKVAKNENKNVEVVGQVTSSVRHLDPTHTGRGQQGIKKAEYDVEHNAPDVDGFWGYVYQKNEPSVDAGTEILRDLAHDEEQGKKI